MNLRFLRKTKQAKISKENLKKEGNKRELSLWEVNVYYKVSFIKLYYKALLIKKKRDEME